MIVLFLALRIPAGALAADASEKRDEASATSRPNFKETFTGQKDDPGPREGTAERHRQGAGDDDDPWARAVAEDRRIREGLESASDLRAVVR